MKTWTHWSLNGHSNGFSDEAVWVDRWGSQFSNSFEVGFNTGVGAPGVYSNAMYPYWTQADGQNEHDYTSDPLPTDTNIWNSATSNGSYSWAYVNNQFLAKVPYGVATPRYNYEQAEVNYHDIWMAGGGNSLNAEWQKTGGVWYDWGYIQGSADTGYNYFIQLYQPNGAVEGGYGKAC